MFLRRAAVVLPHSRRFFSTDKTYDISSVIAEMNKEMESVFGECPPSELADSINSNHAAGESRLKPLFLTFASQPLFLIHRCLFQEMESVFGECPPSELADSINSNHAAGESRLKPHGLAGSNCEKFSRPQESQFANQKLNHNAVGLTHIGSAGEAQMVDVSPKENTKRIAIASCKVILGKKVFDMVLANQMAKGDVLTVAKIAGINGAKHTSNFIPLCHNIMLTHVRVDLVMNQEDHSVKIEGEAASSGKTGVEMEAMMAVTVAGLTVYDMCKAASKEIQMTDVRLERKSGGKSGDWSRV